MTKNRARISKSITKKKTVFLGIAVLIFCGVMAFCLWRRMALSAEDTGIPRVYIEIDPEEYDKVITSQDHSYRSQGGSIRIELPKKYNSEFGTIDSQTVGKELELEYLKGRGNSTWLHDKKPFTIKLDKSTDILGMGESKHWLLIANAYDESLLRNRIAMYMGRRLGLQYTPRMLPVDVFINDRYNGSYVLSQKIRIEHASVDIDDIPQKTTDGPEITGGYLLALNPRPDEPSDDTFTTSHGVSFLMDDPSFSDDDDRMSEQKDYISDYIQLTEDTVFSEGSLSGNGIPYTEYMDTDSAAKFWWLQEFIANPDAFRTSSTYLYKKRDGKLYWGPLWDFDVAMNPAMYSDTLNNTQMSWLDHLRGYDPEYRELLSEVWQDYDLILEEIVCDGGVLDQYSDEIRKSWLRNNELWHISENGPECFDSEVTLIKQYINHRRDQISLSIDESLEDVSEPDAPVVEAAIPVSYETPGCIASGRSGTCKWIIDENGHMVISPSDGVSGVMDSWDNASQRPWSAYVRKIRSVSFEGAVSAKTCLAMFYGCYYLSDIDLSGLDTSQVVNMRGMFAWCYSLDHVDVSCLDTSNVTNMREMFLDCDSLKELDVHTFDTSKVTSMKSMFANCRKLTELNLEGIDTSAVTDMSGMFSGTSLLSIDLSGFNTSNVTTMRSMFYCCRALKDIDFGEPDISSVTDMSYMFAECESLSSVNPKIDTSKVTNTDSMFLFCPNLK